MTINEKKETILIGLYDLLKSGELKGKLCPLTNLLDIDRIESRRIGIDLKNSGLIMGQAVSSGFVANLTIRGEEYAESIINRRNQKESIRSEYDQKPPLKMKEKYDLILKKLYYKKTSGFFEVIDLLKPYEDISLDEAIDIGQALEHKRYVKTSFSKSNAAVSISASGKEYVEEYLMKIYEYAPNDLFSENEKDIIIEKLDELLARINTLEVGHQVIYDDFEVEFKSLKETLNVLGKKDWKSLLTGKLVDAGLGEVAEEVFKLVTDVFTNEKLLS